MLKEAIQHLTDSNYAFALDEKTIVFRIRTKKDDIQRCTLFYGDRVCEQNPITTEKIPMEKVSSDQLFNYYECTVFSEYTRICYYFLLEDENEKLYYFGDEFHLTAEYDRTEYYQFAYNRREDIVRMDEEGREVVTDILSQAERAGEIVRNLLDFSRTEKAGFSPLAPDVVVKSSMALLKNQLLVSGLSMGVNVPHDLAPISGNLRHLQQVFLNLLQNAIAATPAGGTITVEGADEGDFVRLTVRDTGTGIDKDSLPHIFEPFYTTKEVGKGTGLGLAVTYSIIKRHGGRIEVDSEPGRGTAFNVLLPKAPAAPGPMEVVGGGR